MGQELDKAKLKVIHVIWDKNWTKQNLKLFIYSVHITTLHITSFESRRGHGCLSLVSAVCCTGTDLCVGPIPHPDYPYRVCVYVCVSVIRCNNNSVHVQ